MKSKRVLGVDVHNFIIYVIVLCVSIGLIGLGFIKEPSFLTWATIFLSIGASGIDAVILAFFIERSNNKQQEMRIKLFRENQISTIKFHLKFTLNRTAWYFMKCFSLLDENYSNKQYYVLDYNDLWGKYEELNDIYNHLLLLSESEFYHGGINKRIHDITKSIISYYQVLCEKFCQLNSNIDIYEGQGYFNHDEVNTLKGIGNFLLTIKDDDTIKYDDFKSVFELLSTIPEFKELAYIKFYSYECKIFTEAEVSAEASKNAIVPIITNKYEI